MLVLLAVSGRLLEELLLLRLLFSSNESLSLILMFLTWLLRFACDADLKKPPPKMVVDLHATLTVKLRGLGNLSIVVLADAWISKR